MNKIDELRAQETCICLSPPIAEPIVKGSWRIKHCPRCHKRLVSKEEYERELVKRGVE